MSEHEVLTIHVAGTRYAVIKFVARRQLGWQLTRLSNTDNWNVMWTDSTIAASLLASMKPYQRVNHFPGMYAIARKSNLSLNLNRMRAVHPSDYNFYPKTWFVPADLSDLKEEMHRRKSALYIVKPEASSQGRGIFLTRDFSEIRGLSHSIVQRYVAQPYLIEGLKFDLRIYALVTGCAPLRVFVHREGLARFATTPYQSPSTENRDRVFMHLTNYAVNKQNPAFEADEETGHKRSMGFVFNYLQEQGHDVAKLWAGICDIIIKTLCTVQPTLAHTYTSCQPHDLGNSMCFEILGFDILLDERLRPQLLEVNHSPSFSASAPLDKRVKREVVRDALTLIGVSPKDRRRYAAQMRKDVAQRSLHRQTPAERSLQRAQQRIKAQQKREAADEERCGGYIKIFPDDNEEFYQKFMDTASEAWEEFTGAASRRPATACKPAAKSENPRPRSKGK